MDNVAFIADIGSGSIKAELAGAEKPRVIPTMVGTPKHRLVMALAANVGANGAGKSTGAATGGASGGAGGATGATGVSVSSGGSTGVPGGIGGGGLDAWMAGEELERHRGLLKLSSPVEHGHVKDWNQLHKVLQVAAGQVGVNYRDHPVVLTEAPFTSRLQRQRFAELFFETYQCPSLLFAVQGVLSLYASGQSTGLVIDVGEGVTQSCAVVEGYSIRDATRRVDFGGKDVTSYLQMQLRQVGVFLDSTNEFQIVKNIKDMCCQNSAGSRRGGAGAGGAGDEASSGSPTGGSANPGGVAGATGGSAAFASSLSTVRHTLPDGQEIALSFDALYAPDVLFNPMMGGYDHPELKSVIFDTISRCDMDCRQRLFESLTVAGGSTLTPKFNERLLLEVASIVPRNAKLRVHAPAERHLTTWIGASFLAQLNVASMMTKRSEYLEQGERILSARLFA